MKKFFIVAALVAIIVTLVGTIPTASASDSAALVYKATLVDGPSPGTASGDIMVWNNHEVKCKLIIEGVAGGQTYTVALNYGPPNDRKAIFVDTITTDEHGKAVEFMVLPPRPVGAPPTASTPGFVVLLQGGPPGPGSTIATTGFYFPPPTP